MALTIGGLDGGEKGAWFPVGGTFGAAAHWTVGRRDPRPSTGRYDMRILHAILTAVLVLFVALMLIFRVMDGSFEVAGARMDRMLGAAAVEAEEAAGNVADATDEAVQDMADDIEERQDNPN